jgi:LacI family transcriptional regulator
MTEIAKKAGVSQATVSRVLNGNPTVAPEIRQKVMEWVRKLDYQPNRAAQRLVGKQSYLLGIIIPDMVNPFFTEVLRAVERAADLNGYSIILGDSRGNLQKEKQCLNILRRHQVDGILLVPADPERSGLNLPRQKTVPVVAITRKLSTCDSVSISHTRGGALVANHFLERGHTDVAFIGSGKDERFQGFFETLHSRGISLADDHCVWIEHGWGEAIFHDVHKNVNAYLEQNNPLPVTAIFASNDIVAFVTLRILQEHGYRIPDDIAVAGFDNTFLAREAKPLLTSVVQPLDEIASLAVDTLLERISGRTPAEQPPSAIELEPTLVVRESTRKGIDS